MKHSKKERGVALLYVLGILALLMMMGLAFVSSSLFNQRAAANTSRRASADILASSMLDRVVVAIQEYSGDLKYSLSDEVARDMFEALDSYHVIGGDTKSYLFNYYTPSVVDKQIKDNICWIVHKTQDEDGLLVTGRSAFMIKSYGSGAINANHLSKAGLNEVAQGERRIGVNMDEINIKYFNNTFFSKTIGGISWLDLFNQTGTGNGVLPAVDIADFTAKVKTKTGGVTPSTEELETIEKYFVFFTETSKEAYWMDLNGDGESSADELFHRFYLPGFKAGEVAGVLVGFWDQYVGDVDRVNKLLLMDTTNSGKPDMDLSKAATIGGQWRETHVNPKDRYGCGIPWLANFNDRKTFANARYRREQVAANLIDYCDKDSIPTSDVNPVDWALTEPTPVPKTIPNYTGNEMTPYFNEVQATIVMGAELTQDPPDIDGLITIHITGMLDMALDSEAINIYKALDDSKPIGVEFEYSFKNIEIKAVVDETTILEETVIVDEVPTVIKTVIPASSTIPLTMAGITAPPSIAMPLTQKSTIPPSIGYFTGTILALDGLSATGSKGGYDSTNVPKSAEFVVRFDLKVGNAILKYDNKKVDYCKIDKTLSFNKKVKVKMDAGVASEIYIYTTQVNDPRQNLNPGDWRNFASIAQNKINIGLRNGLVSGNSNPNKQSQSYSYENVTDPAYSGTGHMSTAHIRNAPMVSPWELAFIHRGAMWETINLKAYSDEKARTFITVGGKKYLDGGGAYILGDANILDQIKMTPGTTSYKKLNLADADDAVLYGFLGGLRHGCEPGLDDNETSPNVVIEQLARSSSNAFDPDSWHGGTENIRYSSTRAGLANAGALKLGATEAERTEIIGKTANLVEIHKGSPMEYFDAIILSQSIKDIGANSDGMTIKKTFKAADGTFLNIPPFENVRKGTIDTIEVGSGANKKYYIADEVTGQCKLLIRGYRNPLTKKVQLISVKTVE